MSDIGQGVGQAIAALIFAIAVGFLLLGVGLAFAVPWIFHHLTIGWL